MKASDYIVSFFEAHGIEFIFGYQGGMITHLVDSISKNPKVKFIQCYHEQSSAIAAEGYARASGKFGVAISTSGPGATNMITGIANAYFDSIPVVYITGQVNTYEYKYDKKIRQQGFQETDIIRMVQPVTKYATLVDDITKLRYELEKAVHIATTGRKGPVLLDIPMDIQRSDINLQEVSSFQPQTIQEKVDFLTPIKAALEKLANAQNPLILCGGGILSSGCKKELANFLSRSQFPYAVSLMGKGSVNEQNKNCIGMIGSYGNRCANILFSQADVVLVLGSRLDLRQTGNRKSDVLKTIHFIHVDIDEQELCECDLPNRTNICTDLNTFFSIESQLSIHYSVPQKWFDRIVSIKQKYSQEKDIEKFVANPKPYIALSQIANAASGDTIFTVDIGQNQMWAAQMLTLNEEQLFFTSGGMAPMGYSLHAAIGAAFARPEKEIICITGDGGFHIALQSLLLISQYNLNITVYVLNNEALGMITQFQTLYFNSNMAGTTAVGGYLVPDIQKIAEAFRLKYYYVEDPQKNTSIPKSSGSIIEINLGSLTTVVPKLEFNQPLYNMLPYLSHEEIDGFKKKDI